MAKTDATSYKGQGALNALMGQKRTQTASLKGGTEAGYETGTSIMDPVLCELVYRWFCPKGGIVGDPFCGGSVRGIVAAKLGLRYVGVDLSERQVLANREQGDSICVDCLKPDWRVGDSTVFAELCSDVDADMIFSCPPFWNLEVYSDDGRDLSTMSYSDFLESYRTVIAQAVSRLKQDRFACFVVGDVRDKEGHLVGFTGDTVSAFRDAGCHFYNHAILVTATGSLPIRAGRAFAASRKLGKTHQDVLFFVKGSWKRASEACGEV